MKLLPFALILAGIPALLPAGDMSAFQLITLKDRSVIRAQVSEVTGGYYVATSPTLGSLKIPTNQVISITPEDPVTAGAPPAGTMLPATPVNTPSGSTGKSSADAATAALLSPALTSQVQSFFSTGGGMSALQQFSQNKALKSVMNDPDVMKAIQNGDYESLMKSPAMAKLIDNPETKQLIQSILKPSSTPSAKTAPSAAPVGKTVSE